MQDKCLNCGAERVFAYVSREHFPLCADCYKKYMDNEINDGQLIVKRDEMRKARH